MNISNLTKQNDSSFIPKTNDLFSLQSNLGKYRVPKYQRFYRWRSENVSQFLSDIFDILSGTISNHFFNSMVFIKNGDYLDIIDGQQRLITSILILHIKTRLLGGTYRVSKSQFILENENELNGEDFYNILYDEDSFGYKIDKTSDRVREDIEFEWKGIILFAFKLAQKKNDFYRENFSIIERIIEDEDTLKMYFNGAAQPGITFDHNIEYAESKFENYVDRSIYLFLNSILFLLKQNETDFVRKTSGHIVNEDLKIGLSAIGICDDEGLRKKVKSKEVTEENLTTEIGQWNSYASNLLNYFLQFFTYKTLGRKICNKKKVKQPYVENLFLIIDSITSQYNDFVKDLISQEVDELNELWRINPQDRLFDVKQLFSSLFDNALKNATYVSIEVANPDPKVAIELALSAFASINSTGEPLENFDIIKSDIFNKCNAQTFKNFIRFLEENDSKLAMRKDELLKFFFAAKNDRYKKEKIYRQFREYIENMPEGITPEEMFINEFLDFCKIKYQIDSGIIYNSDEISYSSTLHLLGRMAKSNQTIYPVCYAILKSDYSFDEKRTLLDTFYSRLLVYQLAGDSKNLVNIFESLLEGIRTSFTKALSVINDGFALTSIKESLSIRLLMPKYYNEIGRQIIILREVYEYSRSPLVLKDQPLPFSIITEGTIEHIYPQSAPNGKDYRELIGNMTILDTSLNAASSAKQYSQKISYHLRSNLILSYMILSYHIEKYNETSPADITTIESIKRELTNSNPEKPKFKTTIESRSGKDITSQFDTEHLDMKWLVGDFSDPDNPKPSPNVNAIIDLLSRYDEIIKALRILETNNGKYNCDTTSEFVQI